MDLYPNVHSLNYIIYRSEAECIWLSIIMDKDVVIMKELPTVYIFTGANFSGF